MLASEAQGPDIGERLRIVHCFRSPVGGIFRHVRDLVKAQSACGHSVGIVCDSSTGAEREEQLFREIEPYLSLGLYRVPMERQVSPTDFVALVRLFRRIRVLNPDVIHTHGAKGGVYGRIIGTLLRVFGSSVARIYCPHGGSLHYDPRQRSGRMIFRLERLMERMTDAFVFVSQYEADIYAAKVGPPIKPWRVTLNGLQPEEFEPVAMLPDAAQFLYIGMMRNLKGPDVFINALALLRDAHGEAPTALLVGAGPDRARYVAQVEERGLSATTRFLDPMPARHAFALGHAVIVPSRAESLPYIVLEAIAAGRPLISTRVGGIPEVFGALRDRLLPPGDVEALAVAMNDVLEDEASALEDAAELRQSIRSRFSVEAMAEAVADVYRMARSER